MSDAYLTDDEGRIASLGLAALTAYVADDSATTAGILNDHIYAAPTPRDGYQDAINGLLVTAALLLAKLSKATGQTQTEILHEVGVAYAERAPEDPA